MILTRTFTPESFLLNFTLFMGQSHFLVMSNFKISPQHAKGWSPVTFALKDDFFGFNPHWNNFRGTFAAETVWQSGWTPHFPTVFPGFSPFFQRHRGRARIRGSADVGVASGWRRSSASHAPHCRPGTCQGNTPWCHQTWFAGKWTIEISDFPS